MKTNNVKKCRLIKLINCIALAVVICSANSTCAFYFHQPKFPDTANKYKRISDV